MLGLIRRNRRPTALRHVVSALSRDTSTIVPQKRSAPSHHILCAGTYTPTFARLAAESALAACPAPLRSDFKLYIHVDGVASCVRANLMSWLREVPGVAVTYGLFGILSRDRIPGKWHQVMINDVCREFRSEGHIAFIDADLFVTNGNWWEQCRTHLADDVYSLTVGLRGNSTMELNGHRYTAIRTNLFSLNAELHERLNRQRYNKDQIAVERLQKEFPEARLRLGNIDTMIGSSLRAQAHGYRVIDVAEHVPHCHIGGFSHLKAAKFEDFKKPERRASIEGLLGQARLLPRVIAYFDERGWGGRVDGSYRENVAHMLAFINSHEVLRQLMAELPKTAREQAFEQVTAALPGR